MLSLARRQCKYHPAASVIIHVIVTQLAGYEVNALVTLIVVVSTSEVLHIISGNGGPPRKYFVPVLRNLIIN